MQFSVTDGGQNPQSLFCGLYLYCAFIQSALQFASLTIIKNFGFSDMPKDTSTNGQEAPGIEQALPSEPQPAHRGILPLNPEPIP